jgi:adenylate kinase family enzyme
VIQLDEHYWRPGWVKTPRYQWRLVQERLVAGDAWIVDANYGGTLDIPFRAADTVVMLDYPRLFCLVRAVRRTLVNRGRAIQAEGCPERLDLSFLRWMWNCRRDSRPRLMKAIEEHGSSALRAHHFAGARPGASWPRPRRVDDEGRLSVASSAADQVFGGPSLIGSRSSVGHWA